MEIELTSNRDDGTWTWRAAGARQPRGVVGGDLLPDSAGVGDVLRAEVEDYLDGLQITSILPSKEARSGPERLELLSTSSEGPLVTTTKVKRDRDERGGGRKQRNGRERGGPGQPGRGDRQRRHRDHDRAGKDDQDRPPRSRQRSDRDGDRQSRRSSPPPDAKPKPKRLRPGREHRKALLESLKPEERPIAEQVLQGGIPAVREAIKKQNEELKAESKAELNAEALLQVAERIRPKALAAAWRDRADAALRKADELDLRDLRSVVNAAGDAGRDQESRDVADKLRAALAERVEAEQEVWIAEVAENLREERVVRALRLSSRPPKAGQPLPGELTQQLVEATNLALTRETGQQRWATILDALAYSPIRRRVVPESLPDTLTPELREAIAKLASRLPEIAHIFDISPDEAPKPRRSKPKRQGSKKDAQGKKGKDDKGQGKGGTTPKATENGTSTKPEPETSEATEPPKAENAEERPDETQVPNTAELAEGEGEKAEA